MNSLLHDVGHESEAGSNRFKVCQDRQLGRYALDQSRLSHYVRFRCGAHGTITDYIDLAKQSASDPSEF